MDSRSQRPPAFRMAGPHPLTPAAAVLALAAFAVPALASIRPADPARRAGPALVAPAEGARLVESAVRFAFETPQGAAAPRLVVARHPFDPASWSAIPDDLGLLVRAADGAPL